jgi:hypothetical protein
LQAFAEAILKLSSDEKLASSLGGNGYEHVKGKFSRQEFGRRLGGMCAGLIIKRQKEFATREAARQAANQTNSNKKKE